MIRQNYSLANELKSKERKQQSKVQQRQKRQFKIEKLSAADPIRIFRQIERLELNQEKTDRDILYLKKLKEDWEFIKENGLHKAKVESFLAQKEQEEKTKAKANSKLWGLKSIYFNPELNPLGKVPGDKLLEKPIIQLPNHTKPLKSHVYTKYSKDPLIDRLEVVLPEGEPPKFYKMVQNTQRNNATSNILSSSNDVPNVTDVILSTEKAVNMLVPSAILKKSKKKELDHDDRDDDYDYDNDYAPEEEEYLIAIGKLPSKRSRIN
ncbi:uncharacterized protein AC631_02092 [Debaryomyces fabryi]|uniref:Uncharacterized protein n=1 Tax=Debaryomyces fabryi TaxID=58627 RepID=A0A0V1Q0Y1_9ASCO|nr:uncharacterized protein AC631_02092 [Debaryomyces fabryi]KSA02184.1 hypothetical protein AC631_02092 [Debaryomyces fabryi]CUM45434.1 unnamed protein product [Debaryomyces fabryi]